jgi:hypothetical protein
VDPNNNNNNNNNNNSNNNDYCYYNNNNSLLLLSLVNSLPRGSIDGSGAILRSRRARVRIPMRSFYFFFLLNPSSRTSAMGFTEPLTEMSIRRSFKG